LVCMVIVGACAPKSVGTKSPSGSATAYAEDLRVLLPQFEPLYFPELQNEAQERKNRDLQAPAPTHHQNMQFLTITDSMAINFRKSNFINGFTIQVYLGSSSEKADEIRDLAEELLPGEIATVIYRQPNYRVQIGQFVERLELQKVLAMVQAVFPNAIAVPHRINLADF
jgi:hypothetical protein